MRRHDLYPCMSIKYNFFPKLHAVGSIGGCFLAVLDDEHLSLLAGLAFVTGRLPTPAITIAYIRAGLAIAPRTISCLTRTITKRWIERYCLNANLHTAKQYEYYFIYLHYSLHSLSIPNGEL